MSFMATQLIGFGVAAAGGGPAATTYVGTTNDSSTTTSTFTFSGQSFGSSSNADRVVVVGYAGRDTAASRTLSSATIGGISATIGVQATMNSQIAHVGFIAAVVGTASSGDIVLTFNGVINRGLCIFVWSVENLLSVTPTDTDVADTTDPFTSSIDVSAGGAVFGVGHDANVGPVMSGSSFTLDANDAASANGVAEAGHRDTATALSAYAITFDADASNTGAAYIAYR
jgi:hypothetical protein